MRYRSEDFERPRRHLSRRGLVALLILASTISHAAAIAGGMWLQRGLDANARATDAAKPRLTAGSGRETTGLAQWQCTKNEFREYREACLRREISGKTKGL